MRCSRRRRNFERITVARVTVSPTSQIPSPLTSVGTESSEGVSLQQLEGWYTAVCAAIPDPRESETARVLGTEHLVVQYEHALSPIEQLQAVVAEQQRQLAAIKARIAQDGSIPAGAAQEIARLLGIVG